MLWKYCNYASWEDRPRSVCDDVHLLPAGKVGDPNEEAVWLTVTSLSYLRSSIEREKDCLYIMEHYGEERLKSLEATLAQAELSEWFIDKRGDSMEMFVGVEDYGKEDLARYISTWLEEMEFDFSGLIEAGHSEFKGTNAEEEARDTSKMLNEQYDEDPSQFLAMDLKDFLDLSPEEQKRFDQVVKRKKDGKRRTGSDDAD